MSVEFGWVVTTEVAKWLQQAINAAKNRRQQRFAHLVGNAGVIVSGLRSIDRELHRLFLPLVYLRPEEWPEEKRKEWAERILALANEDVILPRMRAADSALETLAGKERDQEIVRLIDQIRHINPGRSICPPGMGPSWITEALNAISALGRMDSMIGDYVPLVVDGLSGKDPRALGLVQTFARFTITGPAGSHSLEARRESPTLRDIAEQAEETFGVLMGHQQQKFPALPPPTWVWES
jgi:hypothetical protein